MHHAVRFARHGQPRSLFETCRRDPAAFEHLYDEYADHVLAYLAVRVLDPEVAFDLMAETFAEAFDQIDRFPGTTNEMGRGWLYTIAAGLLIRWRRLGDLERRTMTELGISTPDLGQQEVQRIETLADLQRLKPGLLSWRMLCEHDEHSEPWDL
jgi:DNA-directed RNA polymerase specialized sigma24 family protein